MRRKGDVNYRKGRGKNRCSNCTMWRNGHCTAVWGIIEPDMVCDLFKLKSNPLR
jgi:hypothetical protein